MYLSRLEKQGVFSTRSGLTYLEEFLMTRNDRGKQRLCKKGAWYPKKVDKKTAFKKETLA
jgi:hypothetical protein